MDSSLYQVGITVISIFVVCIVISMLFTIGRPIQSSLREYVIAKVIEVGKYEKDIKTRYDNTYISGARLIQFQTFIESENLGIVIKNLDDLAVKEYGIKFEELPDTIDIYTMSVYKFVPAYTTKGSIEYNKKFSTMSKFIRPSARYMLISIYDVNNEIIGYYAEQIDVDTNDSNSSMPVRG